MPKLKSIEQIFKEKGGYEIVGELRVRRCSAGHTMARSMSSPAQVHPAGFPAQIAEVAVKQKWGRRNLRVKYTASSPGMQSARPKAPASSTSPPAAARKTSPLGKEEGLVPVAPLDETASSSMASASLTANRRSILPPPTGYWTTSSTKGLLVAVEHYPHSYPHCWRCKTELLFRLVDEWFIDMRWRDEIMEICYDARWIPDSMACSASWTGSRTWATG